MTIKIVIKGKDIPIETPRYEAHRVRRWTLKFPFTYTEWVTKMLSPMDPNHVAVDSMTGEMVFGEAIPENEEVWVDCVFTMVPVGIPSDGVVKGWPE